MKHLNFIRILTLLTIISCLFIACKEEELPEITPTAINLSATSIYERLPQGAIVALLSTDIADMSIRYRLVAGEGDEDNDLFDIRNGILSTKTILLYKENASRQIRVQAILGDATLEKPLTIEIKEFDGIYPSLTSLSFMDGELMPKNFGFNNGNVSPDLEIADVPNQTKSIALTMNDLDDNGSWHWAVWNIPADKTVIAQGATWRSDITVGNNDFGMGYVGPFPPSEHRYEFNIYFLDDDNLEIGEEDYGKLPVTMLGKVIAQASIIGRYRP